MFAFEPPRTEYDLRFSLFGIPVRVHPFFWLIAVLLGTAGGTEPVKMLIWVSAVFVSILIHELGHALLVRYFGWEPHIVLHAFGGLAIYSPTHHNPWKQIVISLAGPGAGFLFALAIVLGMFAADRGFLFKGTWVGGEQPLAHPVFAVLVFHLLFINIFWGLINLAPVFPLDGGQVLRYALEIVSPRHGVLSALHISAGVGLLAAILALTQLGSVFLAILFGILAYQSYQMAQQLQRPRW